MLRLLAALWVLCVVIAATPSRAENVTQLAAIAINVVDLDRSVTYYKTLGLVPKETLGKKPNRRVQFNMDGPRAEFLGGLSLHEVPSAPNLGNGYIRFMLQVSDAGAICKRLADIKLPCSSMPRVVAGDGNTVIAMAKDPDGYELELLQPPH